MSTEKSTSQKKIEREIKKTDKFQAYLVLVLNYLLNRKVYILSALGAGVFIFLIAFGIDQWKARSVSKKAEALAQIDRIFQSAEEKVEKEREAIRKQIDALSKPKAGSNPETREDPAIKLQKAGLEKKAADLKADQNEAKKAYLDYFNGHKDSVEGLTAGFKACGILLSEKKYAEAKPVLEEIVNLSKGVSFFKIQARATYIQVLEELGDLDTALKEVEIFANEASDDLKPQAYLNKARLEWLKGKKEEARTTYTQVIEKFSSSAEANKAKAFKALLNQEL